jgi:hypothetical protein
MYIQAIAETLFDAAYLAGVITVGIIMIRNNRGNKQTYMFGLMSVLLGLGDAFHLVPRAYALWTTGLEANAAILGIGKFNTSITMTVFYAVLYQIWRERYKITGRAGVSLAIYGLAAVRIALCLFPQNEWTNSNAPLSWGIYRNVPFAIMGIIIIAVFYDETKKHDDYAFRYMWLAILLSFALYVPVVLWSDVIPTIGALMIPKTLAYVWVVLMGYGEYRKARST